MSWWKNKKCSICKKKLNKTVEAPIIRLQTLDGVVELEICNECADFYEASAEVLHRKRDVNE